jgi:excinuclease ABC subunit A
VPDPAADTQDATGSHPCIRVRGAREHNLKHVDVEIPRDRLVVITGLSGSGKSSLAFDTLYAEGQRRYVESLSAYARQFLEQMAKPEVDSIDGLSPAIAIEQKTTNRNPRSTVGTTTEIYDHLRLLFARVGEPHCPRCDRPITSRTVQQITNDVLALEEGTRVQILAPIVRGRKGGFRAELENQRRQGFVRARIDGAVRELDDDIPLDPKAKHEIDIVVDRLTSKAEARGRLAESIEASLRIGDGLVRIVIGHDDDEWLFSERNACIDCDIAFPEIAPRMFSFNSPHGACARCGGLGATAEFDPVRMVPDVSRSLAAGAIAAWGRRRRPRYYDRLLDALARHFEVDLDTPWQDLPDEVRAGVLHGTGTDGIAFDFEAAGKTSSVKRRWDGVVGELKRRFEAGSEADREEFERFRSPRACPDCDGARLHAFARSVRIDGSSISELTRLSVEQAQRRLDAIEFSPSHKPIADRILREVRERLQFLTDVGLGYLGLDRSSATLSGGEGQRIRLATQMGSRLIGVLYILDEPSIGLHPRDHGRLLDGIRRLRDLGNTVIAVEHDAATIRAADFIIDMGPGAGVHGGEIVAQGTLAELEADERSLTGAYLSGRLRIPVPEIRRAPGPTAITLHGCSQNNLKNVTLRVPLGLLTVVTGVSGSGKSTLVNDTLHRVLAQRLHDAREVPGRFERLEGLEHVDKVIDVNQSPIGRTPRSNPATYTGVFEGIRTLFSQVPEARVRGYGKGRFSFNVKGGRCEACQGDGILRIEMHFLPDLFVTCEDCGGRRYNRETLEVTYKGRSIAEVLDMTVEEALVFMENVASVRRPLQTLHDVGLDYLRLGQSATTLSGGEAQRVKLAKELARKSTGRTIYLLDEPTTGLHFADVAKLMDVLNRLVDLGNTVVVIEHHEDVIKQADHVIDLGPEGGEGGGEIVATGPPEAIAREPRSHTGRALAPVLAD